MRLDEYQWSRNPRGMHVKPNLVKPNFDRYRNMHMGWIKLVPSKTEYMADIQPLMASGITPIIRIYFERPGARYADAGFMQLLTGYIGVGARWFEYYNEPNLSIEWPTTLPPDYRDTDRIIAPLMANWLDWAERITSVGGYPAFPALAETVGEGENVTSWLNAMLEHLAARYYERFRKVANNGLWAATHPYFYNHFYQEAGSRILARPPEAQNGAEGGWHFEYPLDPITQRSDPGRGVLTGTPKEPFGDPIGLQGMGMAFMQRFRELFGGNSIPVIGTEGGIIPIPYDGFAQVDVRYPGVTLASHAEATLAAFNWIAQKAEPWMFGLCLWKEDDYFRDDGNPAIPTVERLANTAPILKTVPNIEALGGNPGQTIRALPGPGPIHGQPDLHWIILAPEFDLAGFLSVVGDYWDRYRPAIMSMIDLIGQVPSSKSLAVTMIAPAAQAEALQKWIKSRGAFVFVDALVAETPAQLAVILAERLKNDARFG